jgi:hypothetical protein
MEDGRNLILEAMKRFILIDTYIPLRRKGNLKYTRRCFIARTFNTLPDVTPKIFSKVSSISISFH